MAFLRDLPNCCPKESYNNAVPKRAPYWPSIVRDTRVRIKSLVESFSYLGITFTSNLKWHDHVEKLTQKVNKRVGLLKRISSFLPLKARLLFYNSLVLPVFDYVDLIWGDNGNIALMEDLQILQNKAAK